MRVSRRGQSPVMVGREQELHRLLGLAASAEELSLALVSGEAGVGKTRLVQELVAAVPGDTVVLAGQADPGALGRPFELLLDAVESLCCTEGTEQLLGAVCDESLPLDHRVRAGVDLVAELASSCRALVVFEDLHWADAESLALFERLAQRGLDRTLLVATYRPDALTRRHPAGELLPRLDRRHDVTHVRLHRLDPAGVARFLAEATGRAPSYRVVDALHARTGGSPFFLEELLAAAGPDLDVDDLATHPLPWNLAEAVRAQLEELEPGERRVVDAASVLGRRVPFDLLAAVTSTGERELIALLRKLVGRGLLAETEPDVFSFHHELTREAVESELLGRERRRLHEAALEALHALGSPDRSAAALHAQGAGRYDEMVEAARRAAHRYLDTGSTYTSLQMAELGLSEGEDTDLRAVAARAAWLAGLYSDAREHAARWLDSARAAGDRPGEASALELLARVNWELQDEAEAGRWLDELQRVTSTLDPGGARARALAGLSQLLMLLNRVDEAVSSADETIALAEELGLAELRVAAMVEKGSALTHRPELLPEGLELLQAAATEARGASLPLLEGRALHNLCFSDLLGPEREVVEARLERMREAAEQAGFTALAVVDYQEALAQLHHASGDLAEARRSLDLPQRQGWVADPAAKLGWVPLFRAELALEAGDLASAANVLDRGEVSGGHRVSAHACLRAGLAILSRRGRDVPAAVAAAAAALAEHEGPIEAYLVAVQAGRHLGVDVAELLAQRARCKAPHGAGAAGEAYRGLVDGIAAELAGDLDAALACYGDAAAGRIAVPHRGSAFVGAGRAAITLGRSGDARGHLAAAEELLAGWGGWRVEELDALRRRLGMGGEPSGPDALTSREREVVALLVEGLTNTQIGERLYISPRTVGVHVSNVLAKLGMSGRAEVAAWAAREGST